MTLQRSIAGHRDAILAFIEHGLACGRIESMNTKIRLITRIAFGFASPDALIALAMLSLGGHRPAPQAGNDRQVCHKGQEVSPFEPVAPFGSPLKDSPCPHGGQGAWTRVRPDTLSATPAYLDPRLFSCVQRVCPSSAACVRLIELTRACVEI